MTKGYIPIHRKLFDNWLWKYNQPFDVRSAWIDLIQMAVYQAEKTVVIDGRQTQLKRGQVVVYQRFMMGRWRWSNSRVKNFLDKLENNGMITRQKTQRKTIVTLCNYDTYNGCRAEENPIKTGGQPPVNPEQTGDKPGKSTILNKENKEKNLNKGNKLKNRESAHASQDEDLVEKAIATTLAYYRTHPDRKTLLLETCGYRESIHGKFETEVRKFWNHHYEKDFLLRQPLKHLKRFQSWLIRAKEFNKPLGKAKVGTNSRSGPYRIL